VIVFAQLPGELQIGAEWLDVPADLGEPRLRCRRVGTLHNRLQPDAALSIRPRHRLSDAESFTNAALPTDPYGLMIRTQIMVSFQLWDPRRRYYRKYLNASAHDSMLRSVLVDPQHSWFKNRRAITASTYEDDLVNRLHREAERIVPWFVEAYAVVCVDANAIGAEPALDCVFMMVTGGRVVVRGAGTSAMAAAVRPLRDQPNAAANLRALRTFLQSRRPVSVYERYLLESARHTEMGAPNLAVVQGVMIVEWFVNEVIADRLLRPLAKKIGDDAVSELVAARLADRTVRLPDKLRRYMPSLGLTLSAALQKDVLAVIELRNRIVHQRQTDPIAREVADDSVRTLMAVVRAYMDQLSRP
jgi:hypothetical protein